MTPAERAIADRVARGLPAKVTDQAVYETLAQLLAPNAAEVGGRRGAA